MHRILLDVNLHTMLNKIDQELADEVQLKGCPHCGGILDKADYPRSPLGMYVQFRQIYDSRISFCCRDCRKRSTSQSVRFFGRRWYPAPLFIFISILTCGISDKRLDQMKRHFGIAVSETTWKRWRRWWREAFVVTPFWKNKRGLFPSDLIAGTPLPRGLFNAFKGRHKEKFISLLKILSPLSAPALRAI